MPIATTPNAAARTRQILIFVLFSASPPLPGSSFLQLVEAVDRLQAAAADATERIRAVA
jgi:hypothetical protein